MIPINRLEEINDELIEALQECEEYFDQRADVEGDLERGGYIPNKEMRLLTIVREALEKVENR